jgi:D-beta-D-heptose 7-phosphate kinase/D-beta-D-heptose 1-phosphate adenosyltransferase
VTRSWPDLDRLRGIVDAFARVRVLVIGDVILDEYLSGDVDRVSPEAPVPVVNVKSETRVLGGAANVVRNVVALEAGCAFCSVVGDDADGRRVVDLLKDLGVDPQGVVVVEGRPTTRKTRVVARGQQIVRFDRETEQPVTADVEARLLRAIEAALPSVAGAVIEDYGKGLLTEGLLERMMQRLLAAGVPVAVDPKHQLAPFHGAHLLKPNLPEAQALSGLAPHEAPDLALAAERLSERIGGGAVVITRGAEGMTVYDPGDGGVVDVATIRREAYDLQGAGDTSIAALAVALRAGADLLESAIIANAAAGVVVGKTGTATATRDEVRAQLPAALDAARSGHSGESR